MPDVEVIKSAPTKISAVVEDVERVEYRPTPVLAALPVNASEEYTP